MSDPAADATALATALRDLVENVNALRQSLADSRLAFVHARGADLEARNAEHTQRASQVHAREVDVASRRRALWDALGLPAGARMSAVLAKLPATTARRLGEAAEQLRAALQALRVESAVGQRLLDVSRRAQEGLIRQLATGAATGSQRYDRHARTVHGQQAGGFVRGTV